MICGTVIEHVVHDHANAPCVGSFDQVIKVGQGAVVGVDVAKVGGGVAMVVVSAGGDGHQPNAFHPQVLQMVQRLRQAFEIANAIAIAVAPAAHENFHEGAVVPPRRQWSRWKLCAQMCREKDRQGRQAGLCLEKVFEVHCAKTKMTGHSQIVRNVEKLQIFDP